MKKIFYTYAVLNLASLSGLLSQGLVTISQPDRKFVFLNIESYHNNYIDLREFPIYEIVNSAVIYNGVVSTSVCLVTDMLFVTEGIMIADYLKILQMELVEEISNGNSEKIGKFVKIHEKIINCFGKFNKLFGTVLFVRHVMAAVCIGVLGYEISTVSTVASDEFELDYFW